MNEKMKLGAALQMLEEAGADVKFEKHILKEGDKYMDALDAELDYQQGQAKMNEFFDELLNVTAEVFGDMPDKGKHPEGEDYCYATLHVEGDAWLEIKQCALDEVKLTVYHSPKGLYDDGRVGGISCGTWYLYTDEQDKFSECFEDLKKMVAKANKQSLFKRLKRAWRKDESVDESCQPIEDHGLGGAVSKKFKDKEWVTEISYPFRGFSEDHSAVLIHTNTDDEAKARKYEGDVWFEMTELYGEGNVSTRIKQEYEFEEDKYEDLAKDYRDKWVVVVQKEFNDNEPEDNDGEYDGERDWGED